VQPYGIDLIKVFMTVLFLLFLPLGIVIIEEFKILWRRYVVENICMNIFQFLGD
jgi:hypothetical protein